LTSELTGFSCGGRAVAERRNCMNTMHTHTKLFNFQSEIKSCSEMKMPKSAVARIKKMRENSIIKAGPAK
jgi:hypothetical protein